MKQNLRKAILSTLGTVALAGLSTEASAFAFEPHEFGVLTGKTSVSHNDDSPYKSYTDYGIANHGWVHKADWHLFTLGTPEEIAAGTRYNVTITMKARAGQEGIAGPLDNPAFTVWTLGANTPRHVANSFHHYNQLRGPNDNVADPRSKNPGTLPDGTVVITNNVDNRDTAGIDDGTPENPTPNGSADGGLLKFGVINGHDGWIGYAQSGPSVTVINNRDSLNGDSQTNNGTIVTDELPFGSYINRNSQYVNGNKSRGKVTSGKPLDFARLTLKSLKAGTYLIGAGGSCGTVDPAATCAVGSAYRMTISTKPLK